MPTIYTHLDLDVDSAASIWLWKRFHAQQNWQLAFRPATWDGSGMNAEDIALELDANGNGIRSRRMPDGSVHSCFRLVLKHHLASEEASKETSELEKLASPIADLMDAQRRDGNLTRLGFPPRYGIYGLSGTFLALKQSCRDEEQVLEDFSRILDGFVRLAELTQEVGKIVEEVQFFGEVAVLHDQDNPGLHRAIFRRGASFLVFKDGNNLGVLREAKERRNLGNYLRDRIEENGWFFHPRGHLAARGTRRAPAATPSRYSPEDVARILNEALTTQVSELHEMEAGA